MTRTVLALAALVAAAGVANAQTTTPNRGSTMPPASGSAGSSTTTMPGSGSMGAMTSTEVKSKIEASGYKNVTGLKKDSQGNWSAMATKGGQQVAVSVDAAGAVKQAQQ